MVWYNLYYYTQEIADNALIKAADFTFTIIKLGPMMVKGDSCNRDRKILYNIMTSKKA